jgi:hypothetical protein
LEFGLPLVEDCSFDGADRQAGTTIDAGRVIDICVLGALSIELSLGPVNALHGTNRDAIRDAFAKIGNDGIGHGFLL